MTSPLTTHFLNTPRYNVHLKKYMLQFLDFPDLKRMERVSSEWLALSRENEVYDSVAERIGIPKPKVDSGLQYIVVINIIRNARRIVKFIGAYSKRVDELRRAPNTYAILNEIHSYLTIRDRFFFLTSTLRAPKDRSFAKKMEKLPATTEIFPETCKEFDSALDIYFTKFVLGSSMLERKHITLRHGYMSWKTTTGGLSLPEEMKSFPNLQSIKTRDISYLPDWIDLFTNLTTLDVTDSHLATLPKSLVYLPRLSSLNCRNNTFAILPSFIDLRNLNSLNLVNNNLTALPPIPSSLRSLLLSNNKLTTLPSLPSKLKILNIRKNQFSSLPESVIQLGRLNVLDCSHNPLTNVPDFALLTSLTSLTIVNVGLQEFPKLPETLQYFNGSTNQINKLNENLTRLRNLQELQIEYNHFTSINSTFTSLVSLKVLNILQNPIRRISQSIAQLTNLDTLRISTCCFQHYNNFRPIWMERFGEEPFLYYSSSTNLSLCRNELRIVDDTTENEEIEKIVPPPPLSTTSIVTSNSVTTYDDNMPVDFKTETRFETRFATYRKKGIFTGEQIRDERRTQPQMGLGEERSEEDAPCKKFL